MDFYLPNPSHFQSIVLEQDKDNSNMEEKKSLTDILSVKKVESYSIRQKGPYFKVLRWYKINGLFL